MAGKRKKSKKGRVKLFSKLLLNSKPTSATIARARLPAHSMICHQCDLRTQLPPLLPGMEARCPRCNDALCAIPHAPYEGPLAMATSALCFLILACAFPFLTMSVQGKVSQISLLQSAETLIQQDFAVLAELLLIFVLVTPLVFLSILIYLYEGLRQQRKLPGAAFLNRTIAKLKPWMMVDVFMLGVLVSMIKMTSYADLSPGWSFWAFLCFMLTLTRASSMVNAHWLHQQSARLQAINPLETEPEEALGCKVCGFLSPITATQCVHCASPLHHRHPHSLQITLALLAAAVIFYLPANLYPMMVTEALGATTTSTILQGVVLLWDLGSYPVALVILIASVFIPMIKMLSISLLCLAAWRAQRGKPLHYTKLYRFTEFIGRWSMVDVFVVAILVALVQMGSLMSIYPGTASLSFAVVVILTMLSAMSFDVRLIWDQTQNRTQSEPSSGIKNG